MVNAIVQTCYRLPLERDDEEELLDRDEELLDEPEDDLEDEEDER